MFGLGFVLSFGYWTTNFAEVQRALSAKNMSAPPGARRSSRAFPKLFIPVLTIIPGLIALVVFPKLGADKGDLHYNNAIPLLMEQYLPNGVLGIAVTGLLAAFMAGMAANVSASTPSSPTTSGRTTSGRTGPTTTTCGSAGSSPSSACCIGIGTAFIAAGFSNIMNYIQALFSFFNAPLFATFIIGMFWKRMTAWAGFWSAADRGTLGAAFIFVTSDERGRQLRLRRATAVHLRIGAAASFWGAVVAFVLDASSSRVVVTLMTDPKTDEELEGLVYGVGPPV